MRKSGAENGRISDKYQYRVGRQWPTLDGFTNLKFHSSEYPMVWNKQVYLDRRIKHGEHKFNEQ